MSEVYRLQIAGGWLNFSKDADQYLCVFTGFEGVDHAVVSIDRHVHPSGNIYIAALEGLRDIFDIHNVTYFDLLDQMYVTHGQTESVYYHPNGSAQYEFVVEPIMQRVTVIYYRKRIIQTKFNRHSWMRWPNRASAHRQTLREIFLHFDVEEVA